MPRQEYAGREYFARLVQVPNRFSTRGIADVRQFFIRQTVNTLLGNSDAHLKKYSVLYHNGLMAELSPAYSIVCVAALPGFQDSAPMSPSTSTSERKRWTTSCPWPKARASPSVSPARPSSKPSAG